MTSFVCGACGTAYGAGEAHPCGGRSDFGSIGGGGAGVVGITSPSRAQTVTVARVEPVMSTYELVDVIEAHYVSMRKTLEPIAIDHPLPGGGNAERSIQKLEYLRAQADRCIELFKHIARRNAAKEPDLA